MVSYIRRFTDCSRHSYHALAAGRGGRSFFSPRDYSGTQAWSFLLASPCLVYKEEEKVPVGSPDQVSGRFWKWPVSPHSMGHDTGTWPSHRGDWAGKLHFLASQVKKELISVSATAEYLLKGF